MTECIVCGGGEFKPVYNNVLLKCQACSFMTANIELDEKSLKEAYEEYYKDGGLYFHYLDAGRVYLSDFRKKIKHILKRVQRSEIGTVLEIGCGHGFFAKALREELGEGLDYTGFDLNKSAVDYGKANLGENLIHGDFLEYPEEKKYTDIFMWDVIEHFKEPERYIEKLSRQCTCGGRLYIYTPDIGAMLPRLRKGKWRKIHPPTHLHYFSQKTIGLLLERYGFSVQDISYPTSYKNLKQGFYYTFMKNRRPSGVVRFLFGLIPEGLDIPVNMFDNMLVIARKG